MARLCLVLLTHLFDLFVTVSGYNRLGWGGGVGGTVMWVWHMCVCLCLRGSVRLAVHHAKWFDLLDIKTKMFEDGLSIASRYSAFWRLKGHR